MQAIMMSIRPRWIAKILNGEKTIEIRKRFPKDYVGWVYIYCTKDKNLMGKFGDGLYHEETNDSCWANGCSWNLPKHYLNGKVVARFWCNRIDIYHILPTERIMPFNRNVESKLKGLCLTKEEIMAYGNGDDYYAHLIHITKLEIFDEPKELYEFKVSRPFTYTNGLKSFLYYPLTKAPESYCYVEIENE